MTNVLGYLYPSLPSEPEYFARVLRSDGHCIPYGDRLGLHAVTGRLTPVRLEARLRPILLGFNRVSHSFVVPIVLLELLFER